MEMTKNLEDLEKGLTCGACKKHYTEPKLLSCLHYFCKKCIQDLVEDTETSTVTVLCPECHTETLLPEEGVNNLKLPFFISRMKSAHSRLALAQGKVVGNCENCSQDTAESFCQQCSEFICEQCVLSHQRMKTFCGHKILSLEEAKAVVGSDPTVSKCETHNEEVKIYCFECNSFICRDCAIKDHNGHRHEYTTVAGPKVKEQLLKLLDPLREVKGKLSVALEEIQISRTEVKGQLDSVSTKVTTAFKELKETLARREQELLDETASTVAQKVEKLTAQETKLTSSVAVAESVIEYTEQCLEHSTDDEVMCMCAELQGRIETEIRGQNKAIHPVEEADLGVEIVCIDKLKEICYRKANLLKVPVLCPCNVSGKGLESAGVNRTAEFTCEFVRASDGKLQSVLMNLANGDITKCRVNLIKGNEYRVQYTPSIRGRHEIILSTEKRGIANSPFPVFVSIQPTQLVTSVKVINAAEPLFVAVNSTGDVIVIGRTDLTIYNKEGMQSNNVSILAEYSIYPGGVAIDSEDYIYIPGNNDTIHEILKLTSGLKMVKSTDVSASLQNATFSEDKLLVCNSEDGNIMVFSKALELQKTIDVFSQVPDGHFKDVRDIATDSEGNLYISCNNSPVNVFSSSGQFLRSLGDNSLALGVCVSGDYVYTTSYITHDVLAYTTEGEQITSFVFNSLWGVCNDMDGFIYICDWENDRVIVM